MSAYLRLVRAPNLLTAAADVAAGFALMAAVDGVWAGASWGPAWGRLLALALISAALYAAGATFNDCLDLEHDRQARPDRPLPSGAATLRGALLLAAALTMGAMAAAMFLGRATVVYAALIVTGIWLYDAVLKRYPLAGAAALGGCRFLNMQLGMSTGQSLGYFHIHTELWLAPLLLGCYSAVITLVSHYEDRPAGRAAPWALRGAAAAAAAIFVLAALLVAETAAGRALLAVLALAAAGLTGAVLLRPTFMTVRRAVAAAVLLVIAFDAALILGAREAPVGLGLLVLAALPAAALLAWKIPPS